MHTKNANFIIYLVVYIIFLWIIPVSISFEKLGYMIPYVAYLTTIIYALDSLRNFFTLEISKIKKNNKIHNQILNTEEILLSLRQSQFLYLKKNLILDVLTVIPWNIISFEHSYLLLLLKLLRLINLHKYLSKNPYSRFFRRKLEETMGVGQAFSSIFLLLAILCAFLHLQGCTIFLLGRLTDYTYAPLAVNLNNTVGEQV